VAYINDSFPQITLTFQHIRKSTRYRINGKGEVSGSSQIVNSDSGKAGAEGARFTSSLKLVIVHTQCQGVL
jgi:hypothetical protein